MSVWYDNELHMHVHVHAFHNTSAQHCHVPCADGVFGQVMHTVMQIMPTDPGQVLNIVTTQVLAFAHQCS